MRSKYILLLLLLLPVFALGSGESEVSVLREVSDSTSACPQKWERYKFKRLFLLRWNTPVIFDEKEQKEISSLSDLTYFLHNNFYSDSDVLEVKNEILKTHDLSLALFLALSAEYVLPLSKKEGVLQFLREELPVLKPKEDSDDLLKDIYFSLRVIIASYFSSPGEDKDVSSRLILFGKMFEMTADDLKVMKKDVLLSTDDELKFLYLSVGLKYKMPFSEDDILILKQLRNSSQINSEMYSSLCAFLDLKTQPSHRKRKS